MYPAGLSVKIDCGAYEHYGLTDGWGYVIHNSKERGEVVREPEYVFADGRGIRVSGIAGSDPYQAVETAMGYLGVPYNLFSLNCEHFVRLCHGLDKQSPQLQKYMLCIALSTMTLKSRNSSLRVGSAVSLIATVLTPSDESPIPNALLAFGVAFGVAAVFS